MNPLGRAPRGSLPTTVRLGACLERALVGGAVYLSWVLADTVQVILGGAPDEATATRLAASLPLAALARLAGVR